MQTQTQQTNKKNKVTVPFYSPPCRLYTQTSSDIIKEAREAIMTTSPIGIKPVFTSRPFTPNPKERTLFGNVKKSKNRPPSSFSLSYLRNKESNSRVKLPSIEIVSRKKNNTYHYSKNLSLDNLTEDYDAEVFEESKTANAGNLPIWKKSHSCPKGGRLSKAASLNDVNHPNRNFNYHKTEDGSILLEKRNLDIFKYDDTLKEGMLFGDSLKSEQDENKQEQIWQYQQNSLMTKGGGDYKVPQSITKELKADNNKQKTDSESSFLIGDLSVKSKQKDTLTEDQAIQEETLFKKVTENEDKKKFVQQKSSNKSNKSEEEITKEQPKEFQSKQFCKNDSVSEKSVATESKSSYLMSLKADNKTSEIVKQPESVPLEILELHETARYYGVDQEETGSKTSSVKTSPFQSFFINTAEKSNHIYPLKTNLERSNINKKSEATADFMMKNQATVRAKEISSEYVEYAMNDKKRYHTAADRTDNRQKAYKKWNKMQDTNNSYVQPNVSNDGWDLFWKNSYYRDKDEKEEESSRDADVNSLRRLVSHIPELIKTGADSNEIYETTSQLFEFIKTNKVVLDNKLKNKISKALYLYVDNENAEILLSLAKIFFVLKDENYLSVACKIIFKVARFDTNDHLFLNEEELLELFLEGIGRASPLDCAESCVYSYGALKFLTLNYNILSRILHMGVLDLMTLHLKMINNAYFENGKVDEQTQHALFQLTGALRHVASGEGAVPLFLTTNCIDILCNSLQLFCKDEDICINISRTLSLLSTDETVTQVLMEVKNILITLIDIIEQYKENDKIVIRLAFCLGNIVEHNDLARVQLSRSDAALTVLLNVLKLYIDKDLEISLRANDCQNSEDVSSEVIDDVIVKVIRIIANMSMNPIVGSNLSPATREKKSLQLSKLLSVLLIRKDPGITLLATLGCLNNISYYCNTHAVLIDITQGVERVLGLDSVECQIEAARVLGNLTRHREIRDLIYNTGGVDLLIRLLASSDQEIVRCTCGALVNMLLDPETRKSFVQAQGIDKLVKTLELFPDDWSLASLAARAVWNSCGEDLSYAMMHSNVESLLNVLASSLEEENWNDGDVAWEEFASVATDLLEKISSHLESV